MPKTASTKEKKVTKPRAPKAVKPKAPKAENLGVNEAAIYNTKGESVGTYKAPEDIFNLPWNADLVAQVITSMQTAIRKPYAHVKDRGDVRGGGKKPWQQKGTGRARHGSIRSPLWVGGGVTHGPTNEKNFDRKVNQKMKAKALYTILSRKMKHGEVVFVDALSMTAPKSKEAREILTSFGKIENLKKLSYKKTNGLILALDKKDVAVEKSFRNFGNVTVAEARNLNPLELVTYKYVMFVNPAESVKAISGKLAAK